MATNNRQVIVRMPTELHEQAEVEADAQGVKVSEVVRRALSWYLSDEDDDA